MAGRVAILAGWAKLVCWDAGGRRSTLWEQPAPWLLRIETLPATRTLVKSKMGSFGGGGRGSLEWIIRFTVYIRQTDSEHTVFAGGIADKLGNRYEAKWLVRQLLDVIGAKSSSLRFEGISASFTGFEFAVRRGNCVEWHQTKINSLHGNWTLSSLKREGVLGAFKSRLDAGENNICVFVSQDPAKDLRVLAEKARVASTASEFKAALGKDQAEKFSDLLDAWCVDHNVAYCWLRRCSFITESQSEIDSAISSFSDLYFFKSNETAFPVLREFVETRINEDITTEKIRQRLRSEGKLILREWSLDPTLRERLIIETKSYLDTYSPFGAGGATIARSESQELIDRLRDPAGPRVILLTGVAGSGKSGVVRELIGRLADINIPHLALRIDQHLDCASPKTLGKAVIDREESPAATLKGLAPDQLSVLIVDQVDAVSEVSGRNGTVKQTVLRLVDDVRNFGTVALVIACRTLDLESDQRLKALKESSSIEHIDIQLLNWEDAVKPLLIAKSIDVTQITDEQREILQLPLNLSIFLETADEAKPAFASRNDLFARLVERKSRSIRVVRQLPWELIAPLARLAEWMSAHQRLEAPEDTLSEYASALDILSSEGLIVRSRGRVNFFHESFFDYVYARSFAGRNQSLESLLASSEQHLFRRTQARQILETLRQADTSRYLRELQAVFSSQHVRYHIKVAIAQWLGSMPDPQREEKDIVLTLDDPAAAFTPLVRYAIFGSPGWFDRLTKDGWLSVDLGGDGPERLNTILSWLSNIAGQRPNEIAEFLDRWWGEDPDRGNRLLAWFAVVQRHKPDLSLIDLCCRVLRSCPTGLFDAPGSSQGRMLFHTWGRKNPIGAVEILRAYFDAWFESHPNKHPFENDEFRDLDMHSFSEIAKKAPEALVYGSISALIRSIDVISKREADGERDYSFSRRSYSGHHFRADAFLSVFRRALQSMAKTNPSAARTALSQLRPEKHEVATHIWLETIAANGESLHDMFAVVIESPYVFEAGWDGAKWQSFASACREVTPFIDTSAEIRVTELVGSHWPERFLAISMAHELISGKGPKWLDRRRVIRYLNRSGFEQWCILQSIGDSLLTKDLRGRLAQLRRKFRKEEVPRPDHAHAYFVGSPIKRDKTARMTDAQWLRAIVRYDNDDDRRRGRSFTDGGARQLSQEIQNLAKEQPARFARLLCEIPNDANQAYVSGVLWGLAEATDVDDEVLIRAILNAHGRPDRPYGSGIIHIIERHPRVAADTAIFDLLAWYVEHGEADDDQPADLSNAESEVVTIDDLVGRAERVHIRGINGTRGRAGEALGNVLWENPSVASKVWPVLERRAAEEPLLSVRCCLMRPTLPLYNDDRARCAALTERLARKPTDANLSWHAPLEKVWLRLAFPHERLPEVVKRASVWCGALVERIARNRGGRHDDVGQKNWWSPLATSSGVELLPFLLHSVPEIAKRLIYRLLVCRDDTARMIGAWHIFRRSFQDAQFRPLADALTREDGSYRRLVASIASHAVTYDEYRDVADRTLRRSFGDDDEAVRQQAAGVFREIKPDEFVRYKPLADIYIKSRAFGSDSWALFHALAEAECKVDDIVVSASEMLIGDIERNGNAGGRRSSDLHQLQEILKKEYATSEADSDLRRRLLDLIDRMLALELHGVDSIISVHER